MEPLIIKIKVGSAQERKSWNNLHGNKHCTGTKIIRHIIHTNKKFMKMRGIVIVESDKNLLFENSFFYGYTFHEERNKITIQRK